MKKNLIKICNDILLWWDEKKYSTSSDGDGDEYNVFDDEDEVLFDNLREYLSQDR